MASASSISEKEALLIKEFRLRISDLLPGISNEYNRHDVSLIRFLRARDHNVDKAEEMLRKSLQWRKLNDVENIGSKFVPPDFFTDYPLLVSGRDKTGDIVAVLKAGQYDIRKGIDAGYKKEYITFAIQSFEYGVGLCRNITTKEDYRFKTYVLVDLEGFQFRQVVCKDVIDIVLEMTRILEANYPETLKAMRVINAPKIFAVLWSLIRPILSDYTLSKINIFGSNKEQWKAQLRKEIDFDSLPAEYGGGVNCLRKADYSRYDSFPKIQNYPDKEMTEVVVEAGQALKVDFHLQPGSTLSWNFRTETHDIGFKVQYEDLEDVVKYARVDSHVCTQKGTYPCGDAGKYSLVFDNSYSSFNSKTLHYVAKTI